MIEGDFDYKDFLATDERSHCFIKDLFEYHWDMASTKMPEHL